MKMDTTALPQTASGNLFHSRYSRLVINQALMVRFFKHFFFTSFYVMEEELGKVLTDCALTRQGPHHSQAAEDAGTRSTSRIQTGPCAQACTKPCQQVRLGDILLLQGYYCQVIRISSNANTRQYKYLGVDLQSRLLKEDSSFINQLPSGENVQSIISPIFQVYRVLEVQAAAGTIKAMTNIGTVRNSVPVLDKSSLISRLSTALRSDSGTVFALVVYDQEKGVEIAVDMKVVSESAFDSRLVNEGPASDGRDDLHRACRDRKEHLLTEILQHDPQGINELDKNNRTALFDAVEYGFEHGVQLLIKAGVNFDAVDTDGKTALDVALAKKSPLSQAIAVVLLESGFPPVPKNKIETVGSLLVAAANGDTATLEKFINDGEDVNSQDHLGYTALHEAACFGHIGTSQSLIMAGADVNASLRFGGNTILHAMVDPESAKFHRKFYQRDSAERAKLPPLSSGHVAIVELLLRSHAVASRKRFSDGLTVQELVVHRLETTHTDNERMILEGIYDLLQSSPPVEVSAPTVVEVEANLRNKGLPSKDEATRKLFDKFTIRLQYHRRNAVMYKDFGVGSFIYHPDNHDSLRSTESLEAWARAATMAGHEEIRTVSATLDDAAKRKLSESRRDDFWRWIHLPVNNKAWAKDILRTLKLKGKIEFNGGISDMEMFMDESYHQIQGSAPHARLRRPLFSQSLGQEPEYFSLVLPYFDTETLIEHMNRAESSNTGYRHREDLRRVYISPLGESEDLHFPCTLDQSYYLSLFESAERDSTQVVVKYSEKMDERISRPENETIGHAWGLNTTTMTSTTSPSTTLPRRRILMVNQLWVWKVDSNTFITAFPNRCCKTVEPDLLAHLCQSFEARPPTSMESMITRVVRHAVDFLDGPTNAGLDNNVFDIFEQSIADQAQGEMDCYNNFYRARKALRERYTNAVGDTARILTQQRMRDEEEMCDIGQEIDHLREIKDIRDELKMIERVLEDQLAVLTQYGKSAPEPNTQSALEHSLEFRLSKLRRLNKDAEVVEKSLNHLLDLKQKQGNLNEARDSRRLADQADGRARDAETQNQLLFVFTLITIVFTPISFVSTFMAVPSRDFPKAEEGGDIGWSSGQLILGILVTELTTFLAIGAFWFMNPTQRDDLGGAPLSPLMRIKKWWADLWGGEVWETVFEMEKDSPRTKGGFEGRVSAAAGRERDPEG
ncbi:hypothetical protein B0T14DRAFT_523713 [Immersiella caudata]|uniref:Ankyrin repeat protein n=1 Tax=Immersiella caudata TaxID=314043 RepID=A0AA40BX31_9PEZI|nr:hypothetical protein B0T14DRAFT_523713 [Immersiella caudata]